MEHRIKSDGTARRHSDMRSKGKCIVDQIMFVSSQGLSPIKTKNLFNDQSITNANVSTNVVGLFPGGQSQIRSAKTFENSEPLSARSNPERQLAAVPDCTRSSRRVSHTVPAWRLRIINQGVALKHRAHSLTTKEDNKPVVKASLSAIDIAPSIQPKVTGTLSSSGCYINSSNHLGIELTTAVRPRSVSFISTNLLRPSGEPDNMERRRESMYSSGSQGRRIAPQFSSILQLTDAQRRLVVRVWKLIYRSEAAVEPGATIFRYLSLKDTKVRTTLSCPNRWMRSDDASSSTSTSNQSESDLYSDRVKQHALAINALVNQIIMRLERNTTIDQIVYDYGAKHAYIKEYGFKPTMFDSFASAFLVCTLEWGDRSNRSGETQFAWTKIAMHISAIMKDGFTAEVRRLRRGSGIATGVRTESMTSLHNGSVR